MHPQRWTKVVRKQTVNVQCAERALGGTAELSAEILTVVGRMRAELPLRGQGPTENNCRETFFKGKVK